MATVLQQQPELKEGPRVLAPHAVKFYRNDERKIFAKVNGEKLGPLRIKQAFPLTEPDQYIILQEREDNRFLGMIKDYKRLDDDSLALVEAELERQYFLPKIKKINDIDFRFRIMFWDVETDRGRRRFEVKSRKRDIRWLTDEHIVVRDVDGNKYEIPNWFDLDESSRELIEMEV